MIRKHGKLLQNAMTRVPLHQLAALFGLMVLAALSEGVGIVLLIPLLADLSGAATGLGSLPAMLDRLVPAGLEARLALFLSVVTIRALIMHALATHRARLQLEFVDVLRRGSFQAMAMAEWRWLAGKRVADRNAALLANAATAGLGLDQAIGLLAALTQGVVLLCVSVLLNWQATAVAAICGAVILVLLGRLRARSYQDGSAVGDAQRGMYREFEQGLGALRDVKMHGDQARLIGGFETALAQLRSAKLSNQRRNATSTAVAQTLGAAALALLAYAGLRFGAMPIAALVPHLVLAARIFPAIERVQHGWSQVLHALPALAELDQLETEAEHHREPDAGADAAPVLRRAIALENVTVAYPARERPAINAAALTIPALSITVVTGPSGAGKSTLADLIAGLLLPDHGAVLIDGAPIPPAARASWRQSVAYVEQAPLFAHGTLRDNLARGSATHSDTALLDALDRASAGFARNLPEGLDTLVGDAGLRLSGGERQRVALARVLLNRPQVLILDEATSALDQENEAAIIAALQKLRGTLTMIVISHRPELLALADQVVAVVAGQVRIVTP